MRKLQFLETLNKDSLSEETNLMNQQDLKYLGRNNPIREKSKGSRRLTSRV